MENKRKLLLVFLGGCLGWLFCLRYNELVFCKAEALDRILENQQSKPVGVIIHGNETAPKVETKKRNRKKAGAKK